MFRAANDKLYTSECGKCGARRVDQQLGLEPTPDAYVQAMVEVFREVRRVLRRDGTCWLNLGDSYNGSGGAGGNANETRPAGMSGSFNVSPGRLRERTTSLPTRIPSLKPKDLVGIPWRVAFALQADGWYLRSDIIWAKPNPMPESVTDRPTKAHEYLFLLTRSPRYFYDADAIREPHVTAGDSRNREGYEPKQNGEPMVRGTIGATTWPSAGRNRRSVWEIATEPYPDAHFATFPQALVEPCVLAGTSERGCCPECGAPWTREMEYVEKPRHTGANIGGARTRANRERGITSGQDGRRPEHGAVGFATAKRELGWSPSCDCSYTGPANVGQVPVPCVVLDPFMGSGTTALVARKHGRRSIGIELSPEYAALAARRLSQLSLLA
jgi:DNA modification methylase